MPVSTPFSWRFGVVLLAIAGAVGCGQSGVENRSLPTGPSSSSGPSASRADTGVFTTMAGPGTSYNATGQWHLHTTDLRTGEVLDDVNTELTQHPDGSITFCGECEGELFTLTLQGPQQGATIAYKLSYFGEGSPCDASANGAARLNTTTDTIMGTGSFVLDDCSRGTGSLLLTRN